MEIFEYFKNQYQAAVNSERPALQVHEGIENGSFKFFKIWMDNAANGSYDYQLIQAGITKEQIKQAQQDKVLCYRYNQSWEAKQLGTQNVYWISSKSLKVLYKAYSKETWERHTK